MASQPREITLLWTKWNDGEPGAFDAPVPLVCPRLLAQKKAGRADRAHFYTFSAKIMRMILIDHARGSEAQRRGGGGNTFLSTTISPGSESAAPR